MKKVFIPKGEIVRHNSLYTERLIVNGLLQVNGKLVAKEILGNGIIEAGEIICDDLRASCVTAGNITAKRIAAGKLFVQAECRASESVAVLDYVSAAYLNTGTLSMTLSDIGGCDADEIITMEQKSSLLGLLWASWWRGLFMELFHGRRKTDADSEEEPKAETETKTEADTADDPIPMPVPVENALAPAPVTSDVTIDMLIDILSNLQKQGYRVSKTNPAPDSEEAAA
jgi:hypothetical protein